MPVGLSNRTHMGQLFGDSLTDRCATIIKGFRGSEKDENSLSIALCRGDDLLSLSLDIAVVKIDVEGRRARSYTGIMRNAQSLSPIRSM